MTSEGLLTLSGLAFAAGVLLLLNWYTKLRSYQLFGRIVSRIDTALPVVALTFDDGPNPPWTEQLLALLERHGVKATFFLLGCRIERHPETARLIVERGHEVGNHSYSHGRLVYEWPYLIRREIELTDRLLANVGARGPVHFRAPNARKLAVLPYLLARTRRIHVTFDVLPWPGEYQGAQPEAIAAYIMNRARAGSIIVLHDGSHVRDRDRASVIPAAEMVIVGLRARGYHFLTVSDLLNLAPNRGG